MKYTYGHFHFHFLIHLNYFLLHFLHRSGIAMHLKRMNTSYLICEILMNSRMFWRYAHSSLIYSLVLLASLLWSWHDESKRRFYFPFQVYENNYRYYFKKKYPISFFLLVFLWDIVPNFVMRKTSNHFHSLNLSLFLYPSLYLSTGENTKADV